jgi:hypothetical protein
VAAGGVVADSLRPIEQVRAIRLWSPREGLRSLEAPIGGSVRRVLGFLCYFVAGVVTLLAISLEIQASGHAPWWQLAIFGLVAVTVAAGLAALGRRLRRRMS